MTRSALPRPIPAPSAAGNPSAATHECPGGCGNHIESQWFACKPCLRRLPHALRQGIVQTRRRKYLDAERMAAVHAAEDWYEAQRNPKFKPKRGHADVMMAAAEELLLKADRSDQLGQLCAIDHHKRQDQEKARPLPLNMTKPAATAAPAVFRRIKK